MLEKGKDLDWFSSTTMVTLAVIAVVTFVFFVIWELTDKHPVIDLTLFKELNFTSGTITLSVAYGVFFGTNVLLPLWMQNTLGYTATDAGIASDPVGILDIILCPIIGSLLSNYDQGYIPYSLSLFFSFNRSLPPRFN